MDYRTLHELIAMDTQNPGAHYESIRTYLSAHLKASGARVQIVAGNVLATWGSKPRLMVNAHLDTVRAFGWKKNPFKARVKNGRTYGLGAADAKGSIACILESVKTGASDLAILFSIDEECGSPTGAASFFKTAIGKKMAKNLHGAVVMEPTQNRVIVRHPGYVQLDLTFHAALGHSSSSHPSAAGQAIDFLHELKRQEGWNLNVAGLSAQSPGGNIRSPACLATISIRCFDSALRVISAVKARLPARAQIVVKQAEGPLDNPWPFVHSRLNVPYWTDAATFAAVGVNAVVFGPGSIAQAHQMDEFVSHSSLENAVVFLQKTMRMFS